MKRGPKIQEMLTLIRTLKTKKKPRQGIKNQSFLIEIYVLSHWAVRNFFSLEFQMQDFILFSSSKTCPRRKQYEDPWAWSIRVDLFKALGNAGVGTAFGARANHLQGSYHKTESRINTTEWASPNGKAAEHAGSPPSLWTQSLDIWLDIWVTTCFSVQRLMFFPKNHNVFYLSQSLASWKGRSHAIKEIAESLKNKSNPIRE